VTALCGREQARARSRHPELKSRDIVQQGAPDWAPQFSELAIVIPGSKAGRNPLQKRGNKLNFQVKGQEYFLAFVEDERRWYLFVPSEQGMERFPVYVDVAKYDSHIAIMKETSNNLSS